MKKKAILFSFVCLLVLFTLTGCASKNPLTINDFKEKIEAEGFTTVDTSNQNGETSSIKESIMATSKDNYNINFYIFNEVNDAKDEFEEVKKDFQSDKGISAVQIMNNIKNYSTYSLQSNGTYKYVCRVDNTLLVVKVDEQYKDYIKELMDKLGY